MSSPFDDTTRLAMAQLADLPPHECAARLVAILNNLPVDRAETAAGYVMTALRADVVRLNLAIREMGNLNRKVSRRVHKAIASVYRVAPALCSESVLRLMTGSAERKHVFRMFNIWLDMPSECRACDQATLDLLARECQKTNKTASLAAAAAIFLSPSAQSAHREPAREKLIRAAVDMTACDIPGPDQYVFGLGGAERLNGASVESRLLEAARSKVHLVYDPISSQDRFTVPLLSAFIKEAARTHAFRADLNELVLSHFPPSWMTSLLMIHSPTANWSGPPSVLADRSVMPPNKLSPKAAAVAAKSITSALRSIYDRSGLGLTRDNYPMLSRSLPPLLSMCSYTAHIPQLSGTVKDAFDNAAAVGLSDDALRELTKDYVLPADECTPIASSGVCDRLAGSMVCTRSHKCNTLNHRLLFSARIDPGFGRIGRSDLAVMLGHHATPDVRSSMTDDEKRAALRCDAFYAPTDCILAPRTRAALYENLSLTEGEVLDCIRIADIYRRVNIGYRTAAPHTEAILHSALDGFYHGVSAVDVLSVADSVGSVNPNLTLRQFLIKNRSLFVR